MPAGNAIKPGPITPVKSAPKPPPAESVAEVPAMPEPAPAVETAPIPVETAPAPEAVMPVVPLAINSASTSLTMLLEAMGENRLELWFQPVVNLISREPEWYEGLLRLRTREGEILPPSRFIPQAEREPELMTALDIYVLKLAVKHLEDGDLPRMSVNVSGVTLADPHFGDVLEKVCSPLPPKLRERLILEITETAMIRNLPAAKLNCRMARLLGLELAMDDFGEAFSSMMILRELPLTILKIDGSFAENLLTSQKCWLITDWMRRLGFELGMRCVLEFVSSEQLCQEAIKMDFLLGQGFHLGKPLPLSDIKATLAAQAKNAPPKIQLLPD